MNRKIVCRKNKTLLHLAQSVFGKEIVKNAWVSTTSYSDVEYAIKELSKSEQGYDELDLWENVNSIDYDTDEILIEFSTGKKVLFSASEWASVESLSEENIIEK
jgi:hypothetical protein